MPIYEYYCECGIEKELLLSFDESDEPQVCACGSTLHRKVSNFGFTFKQYGKDMALDSINSRGGGFPDANENKAWVQQKTLEGTQSKKKTIF